MRGGPRREGLCVIDVDPLGVLANLLIFQLLSQARRRCSRPQYGSRSSVRENASNLLHMFAVQRQISRYGNHSRQQTRQKGFDEAQILRKQNQYARLPRHRIGEGAPDTSRDRREITIRQAASSGIRSPQVHVRVLVPKADRVVLEHFAPTGVNAHFRRPSDRSHPAP